MTETNERPLALITGATSGLGEEFARQLAKKGYDLLLVARRGTLLQQQKESLEKEFPMSVEVQIVDLADAEQLAELERKAEQSERLEILVNNAGYGFETEFPKIDVEQECKMVQVHDIAPMRLCYAALQSMFRRKKGYIINVSSVAAYLYGPACAQYMATKAYLLSFSKCLQCDVRPFGIQVQALCPGFVRTGFHSTELIDEEKYKKMPNFLWLNKEYVVRKSLENIWKKRRATVCIPSFRYKFFLAILTCPIFNWMSDLVYSFRAKM